MKVGFISLGCSKNLIDTEMGIGVLKNHDFEIVNDPKQAEMIIVNTCGFIESAKEEAINTILEMAEYKKENCKYLVAMGCLVKRYKAELQKAMMERKYKPTKGAKFTIKERGKIRNITTNEMIDKTVNHLLRDKIKNPAIKPYLIYDNSASQT